MKTTYEQVLQAVEDWELADRISVRRAGGRVALIFEGKEQLYPAWLALRKVNQLGAIYGTW